MSKVCDIVFCSLCARAVLVRVETARALMGPAGRARDIEAVHDMRVATRRLRAALALFESCLPDSARQWRKEVRRITRALGQARDLDVQIETVRSATTKHPAWAAGLESLSKCLIRRRRVAQRRVVKALAEADESGVYEQIEASLTPLAQALPAKGRGWKAVYRRAGQTIFDLLDDLTKYEADLGRPQAVEQHHRMRIAAKHLRYSLEAFEPMYGRGIDPAIQAAKRMQSLLGDMHDCDVWESLLAEVGSGLPAKAGTGEAKVGTILQAFASDRRRRRKRLYKQASQYWQKCRKDRVWPKLCHTLAQAAARSR